MAIPYNIREETARYIDRTFFRVATLPDKPPPCVSSPPPPFAPSIVAAGYDLPRGRPEKWKFQYVQASIMLDLSLPTTACSAIPLRMSENALRWPLYPFRLRHFMRSLFFSFTTFLDSNRATRSSFDVCISIMCVCMCVCGCVQEDWCVFRDEETGGWFRWKSRGIIRRIDEQNIFPSSFDRYYVLEFFDILEYWNRDAWEVWVLRCWRRNEIILHAWCGFIGHLHVNS